jgi:acyl carrier protein
MRERIKQVIKDTFNLDYVPDHISQENCIEWDSMHHLQLVLGLETEFDISLEPEDIALMKSLDDIEEKIKSLVG